MVLRPGIFEMVIMGVVLLLRVAIPVLCVLVILRFWNSRKQSKN